MHAFKNDHVLSDSFKMLTRAGFDPIIDLEISVEMMSAMFLLTVSNVQATRRVITTLSEKSHVCPCV